jgi:hypothetical protein
MGDDKKPVKVRLAEKWVRSFTEITLPPPDALAMAYLAGFEKAKFLCVDFISRYADYRKDPPFSEDEEAEWLKKMKARAPSEILKMIGEQS